MREPTTRRLTLPTLAATMFAASGFGSVAGRGSPACERTGEDRACSAQVAPEPPHAAPERSAARITIRDGR